MEHRTLIIDDDPVVIFLHKKIVQKCELSADPLTFLNGKQCLDFFTTSASENENYLLFLDINMPVMNGWEFLNEIQKSAFADKVFVIMTTSSVDSYDRKKATEYKQIISFLEKPLTLEKCKDIRENLKF
jgi:CheY-like chemotaxis protein